MKVYRESYLVNSNNSESFQIKIEQVIDNFQTNDYGVDVHYCCCDKLYSALILAYTEE